MKHPFNLDLKKVLDSETAYSFLPNGTWMEGGCSLLANSLIAIIEAPAKVLVVGRDFSGQVYDHMVVEFQIGGSTFVIDYDGIQTHSEMKNKLCREWGVESVVFALTNYELLEQLGVIHPNQDVCGFTKFLRSKLHSIPTDRLDPVYCD